MRAVQLVLLLLAPVIINASTIGQGTCSSSILDNAFHSVSTVLTDIVYPASPTATSLVDDASFFTDVLGYSETQIDAFVEEAMEFYLTRYGLDFANSVPDANRRRQFENATLVVSRVDPAAGNSWVANGDPLISGIKVPEYYQNRIGSIIVFFTGQQLLRGTYGGEDGIYIGLPFETVAYGFYYCAECPGGPLALPIRSDTPMRAEPFDGSVVWNLGIEHPEFGTGSARGLGYVVPTDFLSTSYHLPHW